MGLGDEYRQLQPLAVEKVASSIEAKAYGRHAQIDEIPMRLWGSQSLREPGQLNAMLAQKLSLVSSGRLEVDIDRAALLLPLSSPPGGSGGTAREDQQEHKRQAHDAT